METIAQFVPTVFYHVYNHAVGHENLFREPENYLYFLRRYSERLYPFLETYAYCLLPNHFHLIVRVRSKEILFEQFCRRQKIKYPDFQAEIADIPESSWHKIVMQPFQDFMNGYAQAYNRRYKRRGALFLDYIKRKSLDETWYLAQAIQYVHNNAVHHGFVQEALDWPHTSLHAIQSKYPTRIERQRVLELLQGGDIPEDKNSADATGFMLAQKLGRPLFPCAAGLNPYRVSKPYKG